jgi:polyphosphate kinase
MAYNRYKEEFINREISWLSFNERVLQEAKDPTVPLISRMRYLGIFSNNLDEFFKVRVATLQRARKMANRPIDPMDFEPAETLAEISRIVQEHQQEFDKVFQKLVKELARKKIFFINENELHAEQKNFCENYFEERVRPLLVPIMLSGKNMFPELRDDVIYLAIELGYKSKKNIAHYALIEVPKVLPRFVELPSEGDNRFVIFIDDIIRYRLRKVFGIFDYDIANAYTLKVTRDAELDMDDDISKSLVEKMSTGVHLRKKGQYVRLNYDQNMPPHFLEFILKKIRLKDIENVIAGGRYHNKKDLMSFPDFGNKELIFPPMPPLEHIDLKGKKSIIAEIAKKDILLHFPYHKFTHIVDLLREAAIDPHVKTIRITIYRAAKDSGIVNALVNAARNGKQVIVVVELQARFDEEHNIHLVNTLQEAGARVIPGVPGLKVHCKLILISRREAGRTVRYSHVGTGNFNEHTSRVYTDLSVLSCNREIGRELRRVFDFFENNFHRSVHRLLVLSPFSTRRKFNDLINNEIKNAQRGREAWIMIKLNNLVDASMIRKLYEASQEGVKIEMIIRGTCSLIPGIPGKSENIRVVSVVGRFLEHSRVIAFCNHGHHQVFISSADLMTRNLDFRVEVSLPILDPAVKHEILHFLKLQLSPQAKARIVDKSQSNHYLKPPQGKEIMDTQTATYNYYAKQNT